ncbi:MAG TPA: hypothetical protein DE147_05030 [Gammaproteobacteria bacterium]|jgi:uncharacterized protein (DUF427 family)|nr:hypothetical protein [Gammaproteobacteria bacterium]
MTDKIETYGWKFTGQKRPDFATVPGAGEESVWDYPRPPAIVDDHREVQVFAADGTLVAACSNSKRVLETASPPTFYLPPEALKVSFDQVDGASYCEWKGQAEYFAYAGHRLAWRYPRPTQAFAEVAGWYSFYPAECRCVVAGETVRAQAGGFYGGWVTDEIVGPYKGEPGRSGW